MAEIVYKDTPILSVLKWIRGSSEYTKEFCSNNKGEYPVYSANNDAPLGFRDSYDFDGKYITISVNGIAGKVTIIDGRFSINGDRAVLEPIVNNLDINYLQYILEPVLRSNVKGRIGDNGKNEYTKINETMVNNLNLRIKIPVLKNGEFDLSAQKELAFKIQKLNERRDELQSRKNILLNTAIVLEPKYEKRLMKLSDVFSAKNGSAKYTKTYCKKNIGDYEVFAGNTKSSFAFINTYDYDYPNLTFTTDGEHAGTVSLITNDRYSIGGHRTILNPIIDGIDLEYFSYILESIIKAKVKKGDVPSVKWNMIKDEFVSIPIDGLGNISIEAQNDLSNKYRKIKKTVENISFKIDELTSIQPV